MKKLIKLIQEGSPFRLKAIHYVNVPPWFERMYNAFRGFMNEKMKARVSKFLNNLKMCQSILFFIFAYLQITSRTPCKTKATKV
jgi:hypothetical protein